MGRSKSKNGKGKGKCTKKPSLIQQAVALRRTQQQQQKLKKHVDSQQQLKRERSATKKQQAAVLPYKPEHRILLLGEGNCSFAASLLQHADCVAPHNITATTLDSEAELKQKYSDAQTHIDALRAAGARVWHQVDCTRLNADSDHFPPFISSQYKGKNRLVSSLPGVTRQRYHRIVLNFPHLGSGEKDTETNNAQHRALLQRFMLEVVHSRLLYPQDCDGELHITVKRGEPYENGWNVLQCARLVDAHLNQSHNEERRAAQKDPKQKVDKRWSIRHKSTHDFYPHLYPLYEHRRTIGAMDKQESAEEIQSVEETPIDETPSQDSISHTGTGASSSKPQPLTKGSDDGFITRKGLPVTHCFVVSRVPIDAQEDEIEEEQREDRLAEEELEAERQACLDEVRRVTTNFTIETVQDSDDDQQIDSASEDDSDSEMPQGDTARDSEDQQN